MFGNSVWIILSVVISLCLIPPITKKVVGPAVGFCLSTVLSSYVEKGVSIYYSLFSGVFHIDQVKFQSEQFLKSLLLFPMIAANIVQLQIDSIRLHIPYLHFTSSFEEETKWANKKTKDRQIRIHVSGVKVVLALQTEENMKTHRDACMEKLREQKRTTLDTMTTVIEESVKQCEGNGIVTTTRWHQTILDFILENIEIIIEDVAVVIEPPIADKRKSLSMTIDLVSLETLKRDIGPPSDETPVTRKFIARNFCVSSFSKNGPHADQSKPTIFTVPSLVIDMYLPNILNVVLSPQPLSDKYIELSVQIPEFLLFIDASNLSPVFEVIKSSTMISNWKGVVQRELNDQQNSLTVSDEDIELYLSNYELEKAKMKSLYSLEDILPIEKVLNLRMEVLNWSKRLENADKASISNIDLYFQNLCEERKPIRSFSINVTLNHVNISASEDNQPVLGFKLNRLSCSLNQSYLSTNLLEKTSNEPTFDMLFSLGNLNLELNDIFLENTGIHAKKFFKNIVYCSQDSTFLSFCLKCFDAGLTNIQCNFDNLNLVASPLEIEPLLLFADRFSTKVSESFRDTPIFAEASSSKLKAPDSVVNATSSIGPISERNGPCVLNMQLLDIELSAAKINIHLVKYFNNASLPKILCLELAVGLEVHSSKTEESILLNISDISIVPEDIFENDESTKSQCNNLITMTPTDDQSLLEPVSIICKYSLEYCSDISKYLLDFQASISDIILSVSHLNFAVLLGSVLDLSSIEFSSREEFMKRQLIQIEMKKKTKKAILDDQISELTLAFENIDEDHSNEISRSELIAVLHSQNIHLCLLERELVELANIIFDSIDVDGDDTLCRNEFMNFMGDNFFMDQLSGHLDQYGYEFSSKDTLLTIFGTDEIELGVFPNSDTMVEQFWKVYSSETGACATSVNGQSPLLLQKKLVRLLQNFDYARLIWETTIAETNSDDDVPMDWSLQENDRMGGICDFKSATSLLLHKIVPTDVISLTAAAPTTDIRSSCPDLTLNSLLNQKSATCQLSVNIGKMGMYIVEEDLPACTYRGELVIEKVTCKVAASAENWISYLSLMEKDAEWNGTFGFGIEAHCYSDVAHALECIIEPWEVYAGISASSATIGCTVLVEASKRLQINFTTSVMHMVRNLMDILQNHVHIDKQEQQLLRKIELLREKARNKDPSKSIFVANYIGVPLELQGADNTTDSVAVDDIGVCVNLPCDGNGKNKEAISFTVILPEWGKLVTASMNPNSKRIISVPSLKDKDLTVDLHVHYKISTKASASGGHQSSLLFSSNVYVINLSSLTVAAKVLNYHSSAAQSESSSLNNDPMDLSPGQRLPLSVNAYMSTTEIFVRRHQSDHWEANVSLHNDVLQDKTVTIAGQNDGNCGFVDGRICITQKSVDVIISVSKSYNKDMLIEWQVQILPYLVFRNTLPYALEFNFVEYRPTSKNIQQEYRQIESELSTKAKGVLGGIVLSGNDVELDLMKSAKPGYFRFRLIDGSVVSAWSKPYLLSIHTQSAGTFKSGPETIELEKQITVVMQRYSLQMLPHLVHFSIPYWVINDTGIEMLYRCHDLAAVRSKSSENSSNSLNCNDSANAFQNPSMLHLGKTEQRFALRPLEKASTQPNIPWKKIRQSSSTLVDAEVDDELKDPIVVYTASPLSQWSQVINASVLNASGELNCGPNVFGIELNKITSNSTYFQQTNIVRLVPRYVLENRTSFDFKFRCFSKERKSTISSDIGKTTSSYLSNFYMDQNSNNPVTKMEDIFLRKSRSAMLYTFPVIDGQQAEHDPPASTAKYIAVLADVDEDITTEKEKKTWKMWSCDIPLGVAGDFHCEVFCLKRRHWIVLQTSIHILGNHLSIILSESSCTPPYRIENHTSIPLIYEPSALNSHFGATIGKSKNTEEVTKSWRNNCIEPGQWIGFAWLEIEDKKAHEIKLMTPGDRSHVLLLNLDQVGSFHEVTFRVSNKEEKQLVVEVLPDKSTRVIKIKPRTVREKDEAMALVMSNISESEFLKKSYVDVQLSGIGISVYDASPHEILLFTMDNLRVGKDVNTMEWIVQLFHMQLDNMLPKTKFPVILGPIHSGYNSAASDSLLPCLFVKINSQKAGNVNVFELLEVYIAPLSVKVDVDCLLDISSLFDPLSESSNQLLLQQHQIVLDVLSTALETPSQITSEDLLYFDILRIHGTQIAIQWNLTKKNVSSNVTSESLIVNGIANLVGIIGSNMSGSPTLEFNEIVIAQCFTPMDRLLNQLTQKFAHQAMMQAYRFLGSSDIIGNPIGLVEDLGSGVAEFMKITKNEVLGNANTRGEGVKVLGATIVKTGVSSVAKITGGIDRMIGNLCPEDTGDSSPPQVLSPHGIQSDTIQEEEEDVDRKVVKRSSTRDLATKRQASSKMPTLTGFLSNIAGSGMDAVKAVTSASHLMTTTAEAQLSGQIAFEGRRRPSKKFRDKVLVPDSFLEGQSKQANVLDIVVVSAHGLVASQSCDPFCVIQVDDKDIFETKIVYNTVNPVWKEKASVGLTGQETHITILVKDSYVLNSSTIGTCTLPLNVLKDDFKLSNDSSLLQKWVQSGKKPSESDMISNREVKFPQKDYDLTYTADKSFISSSKFQVQVELHDAKIIEESKNFLNFMNSKLDPYMVVSVKGKTYKTTSKVGNEPKWNEVFTFTCNGDAKIEFRLFDKAVLHDNAVGYASLILDTSEAFRNYKKNLKLTVSETNTKVIGYANISLKTSNFDQQGEFMQTNAGKVRLAAKFR